MIRAVHPLLPALLLGLGCPPAPRDTGPFDFDVDGYYGTEDCDDHEREIHPGATEICDGLDNDCDGSIDEDSPDARVYYADGDADGWGDPDTRRLGCEASAGWVEESGDCDDQDPEVHPGAEDTWYDGVDSDCDGADDWDQDGDGWAWDGAEGGLDCDDEDPDVHPGVLDWGAGQDRDCDGIEGSSALAMHAVAVRGDGAGAELGAALCSAGDQDGDGIADLLLGSPGSGAAWLLAGPLTADAQLPGAAFARLDGATSSGRAGQALAAPGDVDGDGHPDLLLGAWLEEGGMGAAWLLRGPVRDDRSLADADWTWRGDSAGQALGYAVAGPGDVDGDGHPDLLIGARGWSEVADGAGAAWLLRGGPQPDASLGEAAARIQAESPRAFLGAALAGPGDVDGDGLCDLLIGARGEADGGSASLWLGPVSGVLALGQADLLLQGDAPLEFFGCAVAGAGDTDRDGYPDLLIGACGLDEAETDGGGAFLLRGRGTEAWASVEGPGDADAVFLGEGWKEWAGWAVAGAGDADGDGADDVLVGAPGADPGGEDAGRACLLLQPSRGTLGLDEADLCLTGSPGDLAGSALAGLDQDGDGQPELLIGTPGHDGSAADRGAAWLLGLAGGS